jgi:septum formation protein
MERIILASNSPRRRTILDELGIAYIGMDPDVDETIRDNLPPPARVLALAVDKARAVAARLEETAPRLVLAADTLVCIHATAKDQCDRICIDFPASFPEIALGKPESMTEARKMLESLSGLEHIVHTGLALLDRHSGMVHTSRSDSFVRFASMDALESRAILRQTNGRMRQAHTGSRGAQPSI